MNRRGCFLAKKNEMIKAIIFDIGGVIAYDVWEHLLLDQEIGMEHQILRHLRL